MPKTTLKSGEAEEEFCLRALAVQMLLGFLIGVVLAVALVMRYTTGIEQFLSSGHTIVACLFFASGTGILFSVGALATFLLASQD